MTKGCNHIWNKDPVTGKYSCCICRDERDTPPTEVFRQATLIKDEHQN